MQYREIVAVTGLGGLYQLMSTKSDGAIVRSLGDSTTKFISSRQHNVTPLESIEIYTTGQNVRLHEVLQAMKENATARPDAKADTNAIRAYFRKVYPDMDEDRVYTSDMKKMLKWFEILQGAELLDFSGMNEAQGGSDEAAGEPAEAAAQIAELAKAGDADVPLVEEGEEKLAKKARAKKAAAEEGGDEEKPVKKTAAKKKSAEGAEGEAAPKKAAKKKSAEGE